VQLVPFLHICFILPELWQTHLLCCGLGSYTQKDTLHWLCLLYCQQDFSWQEGLCDL